MIEFLAIIIGIFFVLIDVSFIPIIAKNILFFDFTLFYVATLIITPIRDKLFYILLIITLYKSLFIFNEKIFFFFTIYFFTIILFYTLIRTLNISSRLLEIFICSVFLIIEILFSKEYSFAKIFYSILISVLIWSLLNSLIKNLFNKIYSNIMRSKIQISGGKH